MTILMAMPKADTQRAIGLDDADSTGAASAEAAPHSWWNLNSPSPIPPINSECE